MNTSPAADALVRFFFAVDDRDWDRVRDGLTDSLDVDYTSLSGGDPERLTADTLIARWRSLLPGFDVTQHFLGPLLITGDGDRASAECNVRGYHRLVTGDTRGDVWMVAGRYTLGLTRSDTTWLISSITLHVSYQEGNLQLPDIASSRALTVAGGGTTR